MKFHICPVVWPIFLVGCLPSSVLAAVVFRISHLYRTSPLAERTQVTAPNCLAKAARVATPTGAGMGCKGFS